MIVNLSECNIKNISNKFTGMSIQEKPVNDDLRIRDQALETIRRCMPIPTLFTPEISMDLGVFIKDQMLIRRIAEFLNSFSVTSPINSESVANYFENTPLLQEIKSMFKQDPTTYLALFYEACTDVLNQKKVVNHLQEALEGRIYTLKNALIAQKSPQDIRSSQEKNKINPHELTSIQEEGSNFLKETLSIHLSALKQMENSSFKQLLTSNAEQLIPFVQTITKIYLKEHKEDYPENPLTFRNPSGYNHHGFVAACVMEVCLNVLGYKSHLMIRSDLDPRVTLATAHSIVEVTSPDNIRYIVDCCYLQFHKDICLNDTDLPTNPVLVLSEKEVDSYVENNLMPFWRVNKALVELNFEPVMKKLWEQDQLLSFKIKETPMAEIFAPATLEAWVRQSLKRVWDLHGYTSVLSDNGFQEIFLGNGKAYKTHNYIKAMGLGSLTDHLSFDEIEKWLNNLLSNSHLNGKNSYEALSLVAGLPTYRRNKYNSLFDVDTRLQGISGLIPEIAPILNAYFRCLKKEVNPEGKDKTVLYGCCGADCVSVMLATDAKDFIFVDLTDTSYEKFAVALNKYKTTNYFQCVLELKQDKSDFLAVRARNGGSSNCVHSNHKYEMENLPLKVFFDLIEIGIDINAINLTPNPDKNGARIDFSWKYDGADKVRKRSITFITADITKPKSYPALLKSALEEGIDIFYMKGAFLAPDHYPEFLPFIAQSLKEGGYLMTADKTFMMNDCNPEECLKQNGVTFSLERSEEAKLLEEFQFPPFDPICTIPSLELHPQSSERFLRTPGSDCTYWSILNVRKKMAQVY